MSILFKSRMKTVARFTSTLLLIYLVIAGLLWLGVYLSGNRDLQYRSLENTYQSIISTADNLNPDHQNFVLKYYQDINPQNINLSEMDPDQVLTDPSQPTAPYLQANMGIKAAFKAWTFWALAGVVLWLNVTALLLVLTFIGTSLGLIFNRQATNQAIATAEANLGLPARVPATEEDIKLFIAKARWFLIIAFLVIVFLGPMTFTMIQGMLKGKPVIGFSFWSGFTSRMGQVADFTGQGAIFLTVVALFAIAVIGAYIAVSLTARKDRPDTSWSQQDLIQCTQFFGFIMLVYYIGYIIAT